MTANVQDLLQRNRTWAATVEARNPGFFARLDPAETIRWDYRTTDLSPRGHPLEAIRARLRAQGLPDAAAVARAAIRRGCV